MAEARRIAANVTKLPALLRNSGVMEQQNPRYTH
jgi:hypothetical protein